MIPAFINGCWSFQPLTHVNVASELLLALAPREDGAVRRARPILFDPVTSDSSRRETTVSRTRGKDLTSAATTTDTGRVERLVLQRRCILVSVSASWCQRRHSLSGVNHEQSEALPTHCHKLL